MKKHRVKIFAVIIALLTIVAAVFYFEQREEILEGSLQITAGTRTVTLDPSKFERIQVSGIRVNGKGEEIPVNGLGIALKDVLSKAQITDYALVKVMSDDSYSAEISAEEVEDGTRAFLLFEEEDELRLVVFGDENSKRSVSDVVQIAVE